MPAGLRRAEVASETRVHILVGQLFLEYPRRAIAMGTWEEVHEPLSNIGNSEIYSIGSLASSQNLKENRREREEWHTEPNKESHLKCETQNTQLQFNPIILIQKDRRESTAVTPNGRSKSVTAETNT